MAPIWTKNGPFWTNMAQGIPGNSHEVICYMYNKFIHTCGRVFALHSGLKRGVRWGVFGFETL